MRKAARRLLPALLIAALLLLALPLGAALAADAPAQPAPAAGKPQAQPAPVAGKPQAQPAPVAGTGASSLTTTVVRGQEPSATAKAVLTGTSGRPVAGAEIAFLRRTAFGEVLAGKATTGSDGAAAIDLPAYPGQAITVTARFAGDARLKAATATATLTLPEPPVPAPSGGLTTRYPNPWFVLALGIVVGGVWSTYGWVFYQLGRLRRAGLGDRTAALTHAAE